MNFQMLILERVRMHPNATALSCSTRLTSYRKLGSRIERATARLQAEWGVQAGDTIAYCGSGHQDAIVLFMAALHCGASLLVSPIGDPSTAMLLREYRIRLVLDDEGLTRQPYPATVRLEPLHAIIAEHCPHPARPVERGLDQCRLLRQMPVTASTTPASSDARAVSSVSAADLVPPAQAPMPHTDVNASQMFDDAVFAPQILATLASGGVVRFV